MKYIYLALSIFVLAGCSVTTPAVSEYRINIYPNAKEFNSTACREESLKVEQAFSSTSLMSSKMRYAIGDYKQFAFTQSEWAESPNRAITDEVVQYIKAGNIFKNVQSSQSRTFNRYILEVHIEDFMQYFSKDEKQSFANVRIAFTLIDAQASKVVAAKTFSSKVKAKTIDAQGGVEALNSALKDILNKSLKWLDESC